jgi:hypothetical protein
MLIDIPRMTRDEIYAARFEIAGAIVNARGLVRHLEAEQETRAQGNILRRAADAAESALLSVTRPR